MRAIPVNAPLLDGNEKKYLSECIETGWISSEGPFVRQLEEGMAAKAGRRYGIAVANGSVALEAAVGALGICPGDEIILPTFTIVSCAAAIVRAGARPVLVDSDALTWNIEVGAIESRITQRTRAIMVVHIYGLPCDMEPILAIAHKHGLKVIEDAAQMHGQSYCGRPCGSFGDLSTFSFYPNKHITTGEGGMIVTDDVALAERCRSLRNLCFHEKRRFVHDELGWNYRMSNLQAAVGVAQLERLDEFIARKRRMGHTYRQLLGDIPVLEFQPEHTPYAENIYWVFGVVLKEDVSFDADEAARRLAQIGIGTRPFFWPMHEQPVFKAKGWYAGERFPVAERIARRGLYLPSGLALTAEEQNQVVNAVRNLLC